MNENDEFKNNEFENMYNNFFNKVNNKTSHETLCNLEDGTLVPGMVNNNIKSIKSFYTHINYHSMKKALYEILKINNCNNSIIIVETGCSAHGTKSTLLWDKFIQKFSHSNSKVLSVDLNKKAVENTNSLTSNRTTVTFSNSLDYLPTLNESIDFLYLDSYDVDFLNPKLSAEHHLKEFMCIKHLLKKGSIILIDDTPISPEWLDNGIYNPIYDRYKQNFDPNMSGKGSLVNLELEKMNATKILHQYQVLWRI